jgi:predicted DNA-binding ribbon-helix-helix protein
MTVSGFKTARAFRTAERAGAHTVNKSPVVKRSIVVGGHKTSVSIEEAFWNGMKEISGQRSTTLSEPVGEIDTNRHQGNLSSAAGTSIWPGVPIWHRVSGHFLASLACPKSAIAGIRVQTQLIQ